MKTIEYNLLSFPGESVQLPKEAVNIGNDFIEKIKKSKNKSDLFKRINEYPALRFIANQRGQLLRRANYVMVAKAGALVHDIGKALDHEVVGTHVEIGRRILQKFGTNEAIIKAMQAHHEEYPYETVESIIVQSADAISGSRPGARRLS